MIRYELHKLFSRKLTLAIVAALLALNGILLHHTATQPLDGSAGVTREQIARVYEYYEGWSPEAVAADIEAWMTSYQSLWYIDDEGSFHRPTREQLDELLVFTDQAAVDAGLRSEVLSQVQTLTGYKAYLDGVQETAESLSQSTLYADPSSFAHRNLLKTAEAYLPLYAVEVRSGDSSAVKLALEGHTTTVLLLFAMVLIVLNVTLAEREEGLLLLVKPTVYGRLQTVAAKIGTLALSMLVLTLGFYGTNLVICEALFGFGDLNRSIQSLDGYLTSPWMIDVGQYIGLYLAAKYLGVLTAALVFFLICILAKNRIPACVVGVGVLMAELAMYIGIPYHSWLSFLRQMNLAALVDTTAFFSDYTNLNILGFPVSIAACSAAACVVIGGLSIFIACTSWCREETVELVRAAKRPGRGVGIRVNLLGHEAYKLLVTCRGGFLLGLLLVVQLIAYSDMTAYETDAEIWYQHYAQTLLGDYSEENAGFIAEEQVFFDSVWQQQEEYDAMAERGEISRDYAQYLASKIAPSDSREAGFRRAKEQYAYLKAQTDAGKTVQFVSTTGYDFLLNDPESDVLDAAKLCFVLAVCFSMYFTMEDASGMMRLILPSPVGKGKVLARKLTACGIYLLLACAFAFVPRIAASLSIYPMQHPDFAAASLSQFADAPQGFSILGYFLLIGMLRLVGAAAVTFVVLLIAQKVRHPITVLVICLAVLELPVILNLLGAVGEWLFLPLLSGHWLYA